jgi:hypothetical protein
MRRIQIQTKTGQLLMTQINQVTNHLVSQIGIVMCSSVAQKTSRCNTTTLTPKLSAIDVIIFYMNKILHLKYVTPKTKSLNTSEVISCDIIWATKLHIKSWSLNC